jgi:hypothetical protein
MRLSNSELQQTWAPLRSAHAAELCYVGQTSVWQRSLVLCLALAGGACRRQPHDQAHEGASTGRDNAMTSLESTLRSTIPARLTILLAEKPDLDGDTLRVQDYVRDGKSFIPVFDSPEALRASTAGVELGRQALEIDRALLASVLTGNETLVLNPGMRSELTFSAAEFRRAFPEPFVPSAAGSNAP